MPIINRNRFTRRGEIEFERRKEIIKFALLCVLIVAVIVCSISMCVSERRAQSDAPVKVVSQTDAAEIKAEQRESLRSVTTYPRLVNSDNLLGADFVPPNLTRLYGIPEGTSVMMEFDAATAFTELYNAIMADGMCIIPLSGYRTYAEQVGIFNWNLELRVQQGMTVEEAQIATAQYVALPGSSEHQYGRSIDVTIDGTTDHAFNYTKQGKWLIAHAHEYGFVIRYPSDKVSITGIAYEPWHLRYVGIDHARFMHENELCLEEYIELILRYNPTALPEQ
ncbi:MAG: M15 family metallopeptidase [Clostridia bacterium]|nr:M15 family metallopeptidase [Clostridia bacterium]